MPHSSRARTASGQIASKTICGRRHCRICRRWRHLIDFRPRQWADKRRTIVKYYKAECQVCCARQERLRWQRSQGWSIFGDEGKPPDWSWVKVGCGYAEEISHDLRGLGAPPGSLAIKLEEGHIAMAWSEEHAAPTPYRQRWWETIPAELEQGLALVA